MRFSIIIPHKRTLLNNKALELNIQSLLVNTQSDYELIIDTVHPRDPYQIWNEASKQARGDLLVFTNSDIIMAPNWDVYMNQYCVPNSIVVGYLVEAGNIPVASENIHIDFGKTPDTFRAHDFYNWSMANAISHPVCKQERGWYMPCTVDREWFISTGGFPTDNGFPYPNDVLYWRHCTDDLGTKLLRVRSYAYHFQNLSAK